jgi:hypothetical protein
MATLGNAIKKSIMSTSIKWWNLVWSVAILASLTTYFARIPNQGSDVLGLFGFFFVCWVVCLPVSLFIVLLRSFRVMGRSGFVYVFAGLSCFYLGNCGLFFGIGDIKRDALWVALYWVTIVIGIFILVDTFIIEIPGFPSKRVDK